MATLKEIRAKLQAQQDKSQNNFSSDSALYAHWNIDEGKSSRLRFLPDADPNNDYFWVEKLVIKLPFNGIVGGDTKIVIVQVPCMEMWPGEVCPVLSEVRPWFKDPSMEDLGRKYWKKKTFLMSGFVRENNLANDESTPDTIRKFIFSSQIFNIVKSGLMDPEIENLPTDYDKGLDFIINKTTKGQFADYSTSKWSRHESSLTSDELASIEKNGLLNLKDLLPKKPNAVEVQVIKEMFEASVNGESYDPAKWGQYFKPYDGNKTLPAKDEGSEKKVDNDSSTVETAVQTLVQTPAVSNPTKTGSRAEDILAQIRARTNKQ